MSDEREDAIKLANVILDRPYGDPDDDLAMLSRQFLRAHEDTQLLDWLEDYLKGGCLDACFEMEGGVSVTFSEMGDREPTTFRDHDSFRLALRKMINRDRT